MLAQTHWVGVNRSGSDPHFSYEGEVFAYGPRAEPLMEFTPPLEKAKQGLQPGELPTPVFRLEKEVAILGRKLVVRPSDRTQFS